MKYTIGEMKAVRKNVTYINGEEIIYDWFEIWDGTHWVGKFWTLARAERYASSLTPNSMI